MAVDDPGVSTKRVVTRRSCLEGLGALGAGSLLGACPAPEPIGDAAAAAPAEPSPEPSAASPVPADPEPTPAEPAPDPDVAELPSPTPTAKPRRPHVLFLSIDDLNDWVGVLGGHPQGRTPNIDALAATGMLFANAHCSAPSCNGSRTATLTGMAPSSTGVYGNSQPWRQHLPDAVTLPEYFRRNGYRSLGAGKLFHGVFPDPRGWDEFHPSLCRQKPERRKGAPKPKQAEGGAKFGTLAWGPLEGPDSDMGDAQTVDWVIDHLPGADDPPTFLACGLYRPHLPWRVPQKWFDLFPLDTIQLPEVREDDRDDIPRSAIKRLTHDNDHKKILAKGQWKAAVQAYLAASAFADAMVGRLLKALRESAAADDTIVMLWSDHGWHLGEKLKWRKFTLWEEATRVPLIVAGPGVPSPGVCTRPVSLLDLYPTLIELCALPPRPGLGGQSFAKLLTHPNAGRKRGAVTTWGRGNHSVRTKNWRYTRYRDGAQELYDHKADPNEWANLATEPKHAELIGRLAARLPKKSVRGAPRRKSYTKEQLDCDPNIYFEDDDSEDSDGAED